MGGLGGTPAELLDDPELRALVLAPLRADLRASLAHAAPPPPLHAPLLLVHAEGDPAASAAAVAGWARAADATVDTLTVPGGHHGLLEHPELLERALDALPGGIR